MSDSQMVGSRGVYQYLTQYNSYKLENLVISVWSQISGRYDENVTLDKCVFYYLTDKTPPS